MPTSPPSQSSPAGPPGRSRSDRLLAVLEPYAAVVVVTHDDPDPDAIAAGWAIQWMVRKRLRRDARLVGGGAVIRAENRTMVKLLAPPLELVDQLELPENAATVLVDCGATASNHLLARLGREPVANVDHHVSSKARRGARGVKFRDVRPSAAATASMAAGYLRDQRLVPDAALATALLYAFRTETQGQETHLTRGERRILSWLTEAADPSRLAAIERAPLPRAYFADFALALQNTFLYDAAAICVLPRAEGPETAAEVADLLLRCEGVERVLCGAMVDKDLAISVRTTPEGGNAAEIVRSVVADLGHCGGHEHRAGGRIPAAGEPGRLSPEVQEKVRQRWLAACGVERQRGTRLVPRREIIGNL